MNSEEYTQLMRRTTDRELAKLQHHINIRQDILKSNILGFDEETLNK